MKKREQVNLFITPDTLVPLERPYPKLDQFLPFDELSQIYEGVYSSKSCKEKEFEFGLRALIQFMDDLSDRERKCCLPGDSAVSGR